MRGQERQAEIEQVDLIEIGAECVKQDENGSDESEHGSTSYAGMS
jgi:hypothetical protein